MLQKLEDALEKNVEDLEERLFDVGRDKSNSGSGDENAAAFSRLTHTAKKEQSITRQDTSTERRSFTEQMSSDICHRRSTEDDHNHPDTQPAFRERCRSADTLPTSTRMEEQPLDCTSDVSQLREAKHEAVDYTMDMDAEPRYNSYTAEKMLYNPEENAQRQGSDPFPLCWHLVL